MRCSEQLLFHGVRTAFCESIIARTIRVRYPLRFVVPRWPIRLRYRVIWRPQAVTDRLEQLKSFLHTRRRSTNSPQRLTLKRRQVYSTKNTTRAIMSLEKADRPIVTEDLRYAFLGRTHNMFKKKFDRGAVADQTQKGSKNPRALQKAAEVTPPPPLRYFVSSVRAVNGKLLVENLQRKSNADFLRYRFLLVCFRRKGASTAVHSYFLPSFSLSAQLSSSMTTT